MQAIGEQDSGLGIGLAGTIAAQAVRWVLLVLLVAVALAVVYRLAPDRDDARLARVSQGAVIATVLWVVGSIAFSLYVSNFGSYDVTYGAGPADRFPGRRGRGLQCRRSRRQRPPPTGDDRHSSHPRSSADSSGRG